MAIRRSDFALHIARVVMRHFRLYTSLDVALPKTKIVIVGENAQGKTTFIEGIVLALTGQSPRTHQEREVIQKGAQFANVRVLIEVERDESHWLEVVITEERKRWRLNGSERRKGEEGWAPFHVTTFMPADVLIATGEPRGRRDFLDKELSRWSRTYHFNLLNYRRALSHRNALLKELNERNVTEADAIRALTHWNAQVIKYGVRVIVTRIEFIERWRPVTQEVYKLIGNADETIELQYHSTLGDDLEMLHRTEGKEAIAKRFEELLTNALMRDMEATVTTIGPHRDDLRIKINNMDVRAFGSAGQQRTAVLALKLS
ncbi:MAG TPA: DNA replication/repair protein RecF, partial [Armatimonadetes bacterium]|nr:DNA replication/repair protein RecF [Armatimonadota bacterium]